MCEYITFCFHLRFESGNLGVRRGVCPGSILTHQTDFCLKLCVLHFQFISMEFKEYI